AYRRLINMFGDVVMGVDHDKFERAFTEVKGRHGAKLDTDLSEQGMVELCEQYKAIYRKEVGADFPQDPFDQLRSSIEAVFKSWNTARAVRYRQINEITGLRG